MTDIRTVRVPRLFLAELKSHLQPEERWVKDVDGKSALLLWTMTDGGRQLQFVAEDIIDDGK